MSETISTKPLFLLDVNTGKYYQIDHKRLMMPVVYTEPSRLGWAGIGMGISAACAIVFGVLTAYGHPEVAALAQGFFTVFVNTLGYFTAMQVQNRNQNQYSNITEVSVKEKAP